MKKILISLLVIVTLINTSKISAYAEDQPTYAVVDSSGKVTNIIVCGESVCGASGAWHGVMPTDTPCPGCSLILQVPVDPVTKQNQGGYRGTPDNPVTYDAQAQVFSQGNKSFPAPVTRSEVVDTTTLSATINSNAVTFGPNNFVNGQMQFAPKVDSTTAATISAIQGTTVERQTFTTPKTKLQIEQSIQSRLTLIQRYLNRFYELLKGWVLD